MKRVLCSLLLALVAGTTHASTPQINVGALFDYLESTHSNLLKRIRNTGDATAYVRVDVTQMHFDADGKASETPVDGAALVRNDPGAHGVIASPSRLIIAGNGQQATRLIYRGARDQERYYRLRFIPVAPGAEEFSLSEEQAREAAELNASVRMFTGYGTILFIAPEHATYDTRLEEGRVYNDGNATVVLDNLRQCERARPDTCTPGIIVHVRPGRSYALQQADGQFTRYDLKEGDSQRSIDSRR
ncbi:CS1 fimbrial subunit B flags: Precursor [Stenotrophomonas rhizophila]|uniref:CS1 fimbrial subunit B flags: Precursor n=1 Tax=Stenotrophomonas rhizophila TaxID=216778 RepID=UPI0010BFDF94|nr:CS1 fimbrial subunit B flags: Precursor [Stenotrophomonas rhizophila]TKK05768.1 CS1 fimbrial subunit B flags: Precursor [Stenotrophomonas rhizophila]